MIAALIFLVLVTCFFRNRRKAKSIGIFHPYCNAGGGGERVLWSFLSLLQEEFPEYHVVVYTGDLQLTQDALIQNVLRTFKIHLKSKPHLVYLNNRWILEARFYPLFTLLLQSLGSLLLGLEAMIKFTPEAVIDTMGYSFIYPLFRFGAGSRVAAYVHYPTISTDMLQTVASAQKSFNNRSLIAKSRLLTWAKLQYYHIFAWLYGAVGSCSQLIFVNSSWTKKHIGSLWSKKQEIHLLYPPCNTQVFQSIPLDVNRGFNILSVAQFRPEKNHRLQLEAFNQLLGV